MGSWMSYADFLCNREHLLQAPPAHAGWPQRGARGHSRQLAAGPGVAARHLHWWIQPRCGRPPESLCIYTGVWGRQHSSSYMLLDLPRLSRPSEHGLEEHTDLPGQGVPHSVLWNTTVTTATNCNRQL